jgi:small-conductance mechanosensitive channel
VAGWWGPIAELDFRVTRVRTLDSESISVPNTELVNNAISRPYGPNEHRITEHLYVVYDEDTQGR